MPEDPKTIAIDMSAVVARQRASGACDGDIPKTIAVDAQRLAERIGSTRDDADAPAHDARAASRWLLAGAVAALALASYLMLG